MSTEPPVLSKKKKFGARLGSLSNCSDQKEQKCLKENALGVQLALLSPKRLVNYDNIMRILMCHLKDLRAGSVEWKKASGLPK